MKFTKPLSIILTGVIAVSLAACGSKSNNDGAGSSSPVTGSTASAGGEKVTLTFQFPWPDPNSPKNQMYNKLVDQYTAEHPNVTIVQDTLNLDQQREKLKTQAAGNAMADIVFTLFGSQMQPYVDAGKLAPLDDVLAKNGLKDTFSKGILDYYSSGGKTYALPEGNNISLVEYNKELFQKAGIAQTPTTFDELLADVKKLKDAGITPIALGEKNAWTGSWVLTNIVLRTNNGPGFYNDVAAGKKTFNDPVFVEALDKFQQLIKAGAFQEGAVSMDYPQAEALFSSGQAAMYMFSTYTVATIGNSEVKDKVGLFPFPTVDGKGNLGDYVLDPGGGLAISANSKHIAEAKDFLNYFFVNYPKVAFDMKNGVGIAQNLVGDVKAAGYPPMAIDASEFYKKVERGTLNIDVILNQATSQVHFNITQNMFVTNVDSKAAAAEQQKAFDQNK